MEGGARGRGRPRGAVRWVVAGAGLVLFSVGCCENPPLVAQAAPPRLAAVRVVLEDPAALVRGRTAITPTATFLAKAFELAGQPNSRVQLQALVAGHNNRLAVERPGLGNRSVAAIVPLGPHDLVFYSGSLEASLHRSKTDRVAATTDPFETFVGVIRDELKGAPASRVVATHAAAPPLLEHYFRWEGRDLKAGGPPPDSTARQTIALQYPDWALKQIRLAGDDGHPSGGPEVVVVHADTGYTQNCQYADDSGYSPLQPKLGYDFLTPKGDPTDPNDTVDWTLGGVLTQPGHGTGTATVLGSPHTLKNCTPAETRDKVLGIAPGVVLIPVRYTDGIILGFPGWLKPIVSGVTGDMVNLDVRVLNLSHVVTHASQTGDEYVQRRADVISISQGGVCSEGLDSTNQLECAMRNAEAQGIVIVAAAGQYPYHSNILLFGAKPVTFPGRFSTTIAVAGSTILGQPWDESARGPEVDITAPAEWVWRGHTVAQGENPPENGAKPGEMTQSVGDGTSFATAIVAGVAARWIQANGGHDALYLKYGPAVASAFRLVLKKTAQTPKDLCRYLKDLHTSDSYVDPLCREGKGWDTHAWGPGLLNADAVLKAPLPSREEVCQAEKSRRPATEYAALCPAAWDGRSPVPALECAVPAMAARAR